MAVLSVSRRLDPILPALILNLKLGAADWVSVSVHHLVHGCRPMNRRKPNRMGTSTTGRTVVGSGGSDSSWNRPSRHSSQPVILGPTSQWIIRLHEFRRR